MFFRKNKELQSLLNARTRALENAETKVTERNKILKDKQDEIKALKERIVDLENNLDLVVNSSNNAKIKEVTA